MLEINNKTKYKVDKKVAKELATSVLEFYKLNDKEVSLVIIGDKRMKSLNHQFRDIDKTTDVLSFSGDKVNPQFLGEIFININEADSPKKYLEVLGGAKPCDYIFNFLLIHGLLHLIGYSDKTKKGRQTMITLGEQFLDRFFKKKVL